MTSLDSVGRLASGSELWVRDTFRVLKSVLVFAALALPLTSAARLDEPLPLPGDVSLFVPDVLVGLALVLWVLESVFVAPFLRPRFPSTPVLGWPLVLFAAALVPGIVRGHDRFDASVVGQPLRLVLYAVFALAMTGLTAETAYRGLTAVLYAGAAWQTALGFYSLLTGRSQTLAAVLSTGGTRVIALSVAMLMSTTLVLALLNLELSNSRRGRLVHLVAAVLAGTTIVLAFGRTTFLALVLLLPVLVWILRDTRRWVLRRWFIWVPVVVAAVAALAVTAPSLRTTFVDRVTANPLQDHTVRWRVATMKAAMAGFRSGDWTPPVERPTGNQLSNPGFEEGTKDWLIQGGSLTTVPSNNVRFGSSSLRMETDGADWDEGLYSLPVLAKAGQSWRFSISLSGASGGEPLNVSIWEYGAGGKHTGYTNLPVSLEQGLANYSVTATIKNPETTSIRALVRTRDDARRVIVYADNASVLPVGSVDPRLAAAASHSVIGNSSFERGAEGWNMQGGTLAPVPSFFPELGRFAIRMKTNGVVGDEGLYSPAVPTKRGDTWAFGVWLKGAAGGEVVDVAIWQYDKAGESVEQQKAPVLLTTKPGRYIVTGTVMSPRVVSVRALVRTWGTAQAVTVDADSADLELVDAAPFLRAGESGGRGGSIRSGADEGFQIDEPALGLGFGRSFDFIWSGGVYHLDGDPHNSFVWILAGGGILALGAFLLLQLAFVRDALRRARASARQERALVVWALAAWFIVLLNTLTEPFLSDPALLLIFWIILVLPALEPRRRSS